MRKRVFVSNMVFLLSCAGLGAISGLALLGCGGNQEADRQTRNAAWTEPVPTPQPSPKLTDDDAGSETTDGD